MHDTKNDVADIDKRVPRARARAAKSGGGCMLTLGFNDDVLLLFADGWLSGCIICPMMELPLPEKTSLFIAADDDSEERARR